MLKLSIIIFLSIFLFTGSLYSQFDVLKKVKEKAEEKVEEKIDEDLEEATENEDEKEEKKEDTKKGSTKKVEKEENVKAEETEVTKEEKTELKSFSKFDFIPGEQVIFFDDFSRDAVGDFPALWNTNGSAEVVTTNLFPGNWMQFSMRQVIWTDELLTLPENYTIEFDIIPIKGEEGSMTGYGFRLIQSINAKSIDHGTVPGKAGFSFFVEYFGRQSYRTYINSDEGDELGLSGYKENENLYQKENQKYHISIWVQKSRVRLYQDENKLFDLPKAFPIKSVKMDRIRFEDGAAMISNIRIAVGTPDMRSKLITEGKLVTRGILFDVNSDKIKPESYGTLKEIANVLMENSGVRVKIVGHTDSDGDDNSNLELSKKRSASVKNSLVSEFGIDAARMETDGKGESQPVDNNSTPEGKANNRRVEFIKL
jgi:OOP family OmpA-OmpF porin